MARILLIWSFWTKKCILTHCVPFFSYCTKNLKCFLEPISRFENLHQESTRDIYHQENKLQEESKESLHTALNCQNWNSKIVQFQIRFTSLHFGVVPYSCCMQTRCKFYSSQRIHSGTMDLRRKGSGVESSTWFVHFWFFIISIFWFILFWYV